MTTHRIDEAIDLVAWKTGLLAGQEGPLWTDRHIRRPRSQKGVTYCGEFLPKLDVPPRRLVVETIEDPWVIPLEISPERDFENLCPACAIAFREETRDVPERPGRLAPALWLEFYKRAQRPKLNIHEDRTPEQLEADGDAVGDVVDRMVDAVADGNVTVEEAATQIRTAAGLSAQREDEISVDAAASSLQRVIDRVTPEEDEAELRDVMAKRRPEMVDPDERGRPTFTADEDPGDEDPERAIRERRSPRSFDDEARGLEGGPD